MTETYKIHYQLGGARNLAPLDPGIDNKNRKDYNILNSTLQKYVKSIDDFFMANPDKKNDYLQQTEEVEFKKKTPKVKVKANYEDIKKNSTVQNFLNPPTGKKFSNTEKNIIFNIIKNIFDINQKYLEKNPAPAQKILNKINIHHEDHDPLFHAILNNFDKMLNQCLAYRTYRLMNPTLFSFFETNGFKVDPNHISMIKSGVPKDFKEDELEYLVKMAGFVQTSPQMYTRMV